MPGFTLSPARQTQYSWDELNQKALLTRTEGAFFVRLGQAAFDRRVPGTFPAVKIGRRTMFLRTSLLAALAKLERRATQSKPRRLQKKNNAK
jgi:hypothetical protein